MRVAWGGELRWAVTEAGAEDLASRAQTLQAWGYPTRLIDAADVRRMEPDLELDNMLAASYSDLEGHVHTGSVVQACMARAIEGGAELRTNAPVTGLEIAYTGIEQGKVSAVRLDNEMMPCDVVVLAGGADMPALAGLADVELPLYHTFGATILTEPVPQLFKTVALLHTPRDRNPLVNFRQFSDGTVMIQGGALDNHQEGDRGSTDEEVAQIVEDATAILPALDGVKIAAVQRGRRPIPRDGEPIVGFSDSVTNLYMATTHSGVTLAPIIGEYASIEIVHGVEVDLLQPYRLSRFK